jgi:hypothetical protein
MITKPSPELTGPSSAFNKVRLATFQIMTQMKRYLTVGGGKQKQNGEKQKEVE